MKAVIPAAGLGTRFLPLTKAQPKEMLPVVDKPAIQWVVEEVVESGITDIAIITGNHKKSIESHFINSNKLELILAKEHELESIGLQAAAAAHSLGTPLSTITVVARELEKEIGKNPKYTKDIDLLLSQTKRCSNILKNLSKDQLKEDTFLSNIKIEELLNQIVKSFMEISEKKITLITEKNILNPQIERTLEITYGLRNFIGNAIKYSNSFVDITLESNSKITKVKVCDDGPGFCEDILDVLGEPYIRSNNKIISSKSGLGLGTFIGKTLLERMKANVKFNKCPKTNGAMVVISWQTKDLLAI